MQHSPARYLNTLTRSMRCRRRWTPRALTAWKRREHPRCRAAPPDMKCPLPALPKRGTVPGICHPMPREFSVRLPVRGGPQCVEGLPAANSGNRGASKADSDYETCPQSFLECMPAARKVIHTHCDAYLSRKPYTAAMKLRHDAVAWNIPYKLPRKFSLAAARGAGKAEWPLSYAVA